MTSATMTMNHRVKATRLTAFEAAVLVGVVALLALAAAWPMISAVAHPTDVTTVHVGATDTLWSIAAQHRLAGRTTAQTVAEIKRLNSMSSSVVGEGSTIKVPAEARSTETAMLTR